jgi:hypothetical protein
MNASAAAEPTTVAHACLREGLMPAGKHQSWTIAIMHDMEPSFCGLQLLSGDVHALHVQADLLQVTVSRPHFQVGVPAFWQGAGAVASLQTLHTVC